MVYNPAKLYELSGFKCFLYINIIFFWKNIENNVFKFVSTKYFMVLENKACKFFI